MTEGDAADRHLLAVAAALLDQGRAIGNLSRPLLLLAFAGLLAPVVVPGGVPARPAALACLALSGLAGLASAYAGARVAFDAALFRGLAAGSGDLASLDDALTRLGLLPPEKAGRPLDPRLAGARRLLRRQGTLMLSQAALLAAAVVLGR